MDGLVLSQVQVLEYPGVGDDLEGVFRFCDDPGRSRLRPLAHAAGRCDSGAGRGRCSCACPSAGDKGAVILALAGAGAARAGGSLAEFVEGLGAGGGDFAVEEVRNAAG